MSATPTSVQPRAVLTTAASALVAGLAIVAGDAAMAGTAAAANAVVPGPASTAWLAAAAVIAAGSYALVGAPQIALGRRQTGSHDESLKDRRSRWAVRLLGGDQAGPGQQHQRRADHRDRRGRPRERRLVAVDQTGERDQPQPGQAEQPARTTAGAGPPSWRRGRSAWRQSPAAWR